MTLNTITKFCMDCRYFLRRKYHQPCNICVELNFDGIESFWESTDITPSQEQGEL